MSTHETHDLRARFAEVVDGTGLDLDLLIDGSCCDGRRIRTRRRLTAVAACAAVAAVVVGSGFALSGGGGSTADAPYATSSGTPEPTPVERTTTELIYPLGAPSPLTGRATAAGPLNLVGQLQDGTAFELRRPGRGPRRHDAACLRRRATRSSGGRRAAAGQRPR